MGQTKPDCAIPEVLQVVPTGQRSGGSQTGKGTVDRLTFGVSEAIREATPEDSQGGPDKAELSPELESTLDLLLTRYDENLDKGLYTGESAPKAKVEAWLRAVPARLEAAKRWEARGGKPMFTGEGDEAGAWQIDECSPEVPGDIRNICYGPNAASARNIPEDRNALTQAGRLGGTLMRRTRRTKLVDAGLIQDRTSMEWLLDPKNQDLVMKDGKVKSYGLAYRAGFLRPSPALHVAYSCRGFCGLRCSLSGAKL